MTFPYSQENADSRRRLESLVGRLTAAELALSTDYGWTVAALLAHLAFWDQRMAVILKRWEEAGLDTSPIDSVAVNEALKVICHALEPRTAARLAVTAAERIDLELESLSPEFVDQLEEHAAATSTQFRMNRALHRDGHLDDIEALLKQVINKMDGLLGHQQNDVLNKLLEQAGKRDPVGALLLTSTRAIPGGYVDIFSDYDVVLVVENIYLFHEERIWVEDFGEVLVTFWDPIHPDPEHGGQKFGNVIQYRDGLKIDFTLWPVELLRRIVRAPALPAELDAGQLVLLDKDRLTEGLKSPTYRAYVPAPPTNEIYQRHIEEFFSDAPYVAKCLLRGELLPAKWCLDHDMKHVYLRPMLEWRVESDHDWSLPTGWLGKGLKRQLPPEHWSQLERTYAGADIAENWEALFRTIALFRQVTVEVGEALGYIYPHALDQRVTGFIKEMQRQGERP